MSERVSKFFIGIDPGVEPAITSMVSPTNFKTVKFKKVEKYFDVIGIYEFLLGELLDLHPEGRGIDLWECVILLEDVHSVYNSSAKSNFQFGGGVEGCRSAAKVAIYTGDYPTELELIQPKVWQKLVISPEDKVTMDKEVNVKVKGEDGKAIKNSEGKFVYEKVIKKVSDTKETALNAVKRILGDKYDEERFFPTKRSYVVNHDMIDSYLIAYYGYLKHNK